MTIPSNHPIILASQSPRRKELLAGLGIQFTVMPKDTPEDFPAALQGAEIATFLSRRKSEAFTPDELPDNFLLITADTIVWIDGKVLNKPADSSEAFTMLRTLSGNKHTVFTGVTLRSASKTLTFSAATDVWFRHLTNEEIEHYLHHYKPYDKAGSYGVQEWIGYVGISRIEGSYYNVMGLPTQQLYLELSRF
jgi:septum formation protein